MSSAPSWRVTAVSWSSRRREPDLPGRSVQESPETEPARTDRIAGLPARVEPALGAVLLLFLLLTVPRLGAVPVWDARAYYDQCLLAGLHSPFNPINFNCFGHPSMLYMLLFAPGQWLSGGSAILLNLTNVALGCLAIAAFWIITGVFWPRSEARGDRLLGTAILVVWPAALANSLNVTPDYGVFVFFLLFLAALLKEKIGLASLFATFLAFSKETGVALYGLTTLLYLLVFVGPEAIRPPRLWATIRKHSILLVPALLSLVAAGFRLRQKQPLIWHDTKTSASYIARRLLAFNPSEIYAGRYAPTIWILSFSWILTLGLLAAGLALALSRACRARLWSESFSRRSLLFVLLAFLATTYLLTRYETFSHARYFLGMVPLFVLLFLVALRVVLPRAGARYALLGMTFLVLLASDFRTIDPVSRRIWGTFPFGRHELLKVTSWNNECCGYSMDQLVYNLQYLKFNEIQNLIFADLKPTAKTTLVATFFADFFLAGAVTREGERTLRMRDTVRVRYRTVGEVQCLGVPPKTLFFVAFPNFDNGADFQRLRRGYAVTSVKSYETSGYATSVYRMMRRDERASAPELSCGLTDH